MSFQCVRQPGARRPLLALGYLGLSAWSAVAPVRACINDMDTDALAASGAKLPDAVRIVTGRFERNPPLYYEMRAARCVRELQANPRLYGRYDDLGAALDRLHRDAEALVWMERKKAVLPPYDGNSPALKEQWYRYYANTGTFRIHHWLAGGAKKERLTEAEQARAEIARAIEIKPDAHFGREKIQLLAMEWLLKRGGVKDTTNLYDYIDMHTPPGASERPSTEHTSTKEYLRKAREYQRLKEAALRENAESLCGLIMLGNAWQSPDVFVALAMSLQNEGDAPLSYLALLRSQELLNEGHQAMGALGPGNCETEGWPERVSWTLHTINRSSVEELYPQLRREADQWQAQRSAFMMNRMKLGRHPDTDKTFWAGYREAQAPSLDVAWANLHAESQARARQIISGLILRAGLFVALVALGIGMVRSSLKTKRDLAKAAARKQRDLAKAASNKRPAIRRPTGDR